jgi:hypothetical protein
MKRSLSLTLLALSILCTSITGQSQIPTPFAVFDTSSMHSDWILGGTLAFLTDNLIAVGFDSASPARVQILKLQGDDLHPIAQAPEPTTFRRLLKGPGEEVFLDHVYAEKIDGAIELDSSLHKVQVLNKTWLGLDYVSPSGGTFVVQASEDHWIAYKTSTPPTPICAGPGWALSVKDDRIAYTAGGTLYIGDMKGSPLGSFATGRSQAGKTTGEATLLSPGRILFETAQGRFEVRDYEGKTIFRLTGAKGWGEDHKASFDGSRVVFDIPSRHLGVGRAIGESVMGVLTLGFSADGDGPNRESVIVYDVATGRRCFEWEGALDLISGNHADISPSGDNVAVLTSSHLMLFHLPTHCPSD